MDQKFKLASEEVKNLTSATDDQKLQIYGLYKQATIGDVNTDRPGFFDMTGKYKWDSWNAQKGKSQDDAKQQYIELVIDMAKKQGCNQIVESLSK